MKLTVPLLMALSRGGGVHGFVPSTRPSCVSSASYTTAVAKQCTAVQQRNAAVSMKAAPASSEQGIFAEAMDRRSMLQNAALALGAVFVTTANPSEGRAATPVDFDRVGTDVKYRSI